MIGSSRVKLPFGLHRYPLGHGCVAADVQGLAWSAGAAAAAATNPGQTPVVEVMVKRPKVKLSEVYAR
jgi:hypothetical protein